MVVQRYLSKSPNDTLLKKCTLLSIFEIGFELRSCDPGAIRKDTPGNRQQRDNRKKLCFSDLFCADITSPDLVQWT